MAEDNKSYYVIDPEGKLKCKKCGISLVKANAVFGYLENAFPVEMPVCPKCGFVYVPEELALGKVLSVEKVLEENMDIHSHTEKFETEPYRVLIKDTDNGRRIAEKIEDLKLLLSCYRQGLVTEKR